MSRKIDVSVGTNIYGTFKNLGYSVTSAISELIDNSIASFRANEEIYKQEIKKGKNIEKSITLIFDKKENLIIVRDSAFGISEKEFERALKLKSPPKNKNGLNEFGMGLKTSSFWFGNELEVISKSPHDKNGHRVNLKLDDLEKGINEVPILDSDDYYKKWKLGQGTVIIIREIIGNRDISNTNIKSLISKFSSKYRRDIINRKIEFRILSVERNGDIVDLVDWEQTGNKVKKIDKNILSGKVLSYTEVKRRKDQLTTNGYEVSFDFNVIHLGKKLEGRALFFLRETGSRNEAGIDLFRRGRIIEEKNRNFLTDASSYEYQRINGWLDLDSFPVSQAKDKFDWEGKLFDDVKKKILDNDEFKKLVKIARTLRYRSKNQEKEALKTRESFQNKLKFSPTIEKIFTNNEIKQIAREKGIKHLDSDTAHEVRTSSGELKTIYSRLNTSNEQVEWISIEELEDTFIVSLDINHSFFNPFNQIKGNGTTFTSIMRLFSVYWAQAEIESIRNSETADTFRNRLARLINMNEGHDD